MAPRPAPDVDVAAARGARCAVGSRARSGSAPATARSTRPTGSNYRQVPIGVVIPRTVDDVVATVEPSPRARRAGPRARRRHGLAGPDVNVAVVIDFSKYLNRILEIDAERKLARVEPGVVLDRPARGGRAGTASRSARIRRRTTYCTLGGMIGNNSCGVHSVMALFYGPGPRTSDNVARARGAHLRRPRLRLGPDGAGVPGELDRAPARARRPLRRPDPRALPGDPAPRLGLQPRRPAARERLPRRPGARRAPRARASRSSRRPCT